MIEKLVESTFIKRYIAMFIVTISAVMHTSVAAHAESEKSIELIAEEFAFLPAEIEIEAGQILTITLKNHGALAHNITFTNMDIETETIQGGSETTTQVRFDQSGRYEYICSVPGHANAGMRGVVIVK
ncbi:MAG: cupredoxin domain-containing protein [Gammaproteobacteria bacterium]